MNTTTGSDGAICEKCGAAPGQPHTWYDDDCVLDHTGHTERHVGLICRRHYHWIDATLTQILELFALLPEAIMPTTGATDSRPSGEVFAPPPGRVDIMSLFDERSHLYRYDEHGVAQSPEYPNALVVVGGWVQAVIEERGLGGLPDFLPMSGMVALLHAHRHWIAQQPWIDDYCITLNELHLALARGVHDTMWPASIGKCPNCSAPLYNTIGVDEVTCRKCRSTWSGVALARLRLILEQEQQVASRQQQEAG